LQPIANSTGRTQNLVIGIRAETLAVCTRCGAVALLKSGASGLTATNNLIISGQSLAGGGFTGCRFAADLG
jgi:hypothetical protein